MILIYSTPTCVYCKQVKKYLDHKQIAWEERDAFTAPEYPTLMERFGMTVPLIYNDTADRGMVGYDIGKINALITA